MLLFLVPYIIYRGWINFFLNSYNSYFAHLLFYINTINTPHLRYKSCNIT